MLDFSKLTYQDVVLIILTIGFLFIIFNQFKCGYKTDHFTINDDINRNSRR